MIRRRITATALAGALLLAPVACDNEDQRDLEEGVNDVEKGAEDIVNDAEKELDQIDTDGKDN